jgi:glucose-6-phosphate 1-dehydrogenase
LCIIKFYSGGYKADEETVQNLIFFRFAHSIFEPLWNRRYIDCIQITAAESIGIEHRGHPMRRLV